MDRSAWLKEKRRSTEARMDTLWPPLYDEKWGNYSNDSQRQFIQKLLALLPKPGAILDAACGAGRYWPMLLGQGHTGEGDDYHHLIVRKAA